MKQTVIILAVLSAVLLVASGMIAANSMDLSHMLEMCSEEMVKLQDRNTDYAAKLRVSQQETADAKEKLVLMQQERDGCAQQAEALIAEKATLQETIAAVQKQLEEQTLLNSATAEEAVQYAMQQEERIAQLEAELQQALMPTATPFIPIRYRLPVQ